MKQTNENRKRLILITQLIIFCDVKIFHLELIVDIIDFFRTLILPDIFIIKFF